MQSNFRFSKLSQWMSLVSFNSSSIWDFYTPKLGMHLLEKLTILWEWSIGLWVFVGDKFWGGAVGWYDKNICLMGKLICAVVTQIFLNWIMYWDITLNVFKVNYIENDKIQVFLWKMRLWETISTRSSEK